MQKRQRLIALMLLVALVVVALTGCGTTQVKKLDPSSPWDAYLVIPLTHLMDAFKNMLGSYGLAIIAVTFLVRLALLPLTLKQQQSAKAMQTLQPQMTKLREKYKNDPQKMQQETMKLFQENKVNPMAGCFPMLIQMPILIAFYQSITYNPLIFHATFLSMKLGLPDPFFILPLLAAATTYIQLRVTGAANNPQMKMMLFVMPVMIFVMAFKFPSALSLYWATGNLFTILQYLVLFRKKNNNALQEGTTR